MSTFPGKFRPACAFAKSGRVWQGSSRWRCGTFPRPAAERRSVGRRRMRLGVCIAMACAAWACATPVFPSGTYELYRRDQPSHQTGPFAELIVSPGPLDLALFHPETANWANGLVPEEAPSICVVERYLDEDGGNPTTNLSFGNAESARNGWKIRLLETHHFWSWLALRERDGVLTGTVKQKGWGGPHSVALRIERVSEPDPSRCVRAALEVIPSEYQ